MILQDSLCTFSPLVSRPSRFKAIVVQISLLQKGSVKHEKCLLSGQNVKVTVPGGINNGLMARVGIPNA